ncbi:MAG TPA: zinc ribbon domain-containing protein [Gammaproteobacteria bacterium]|jgi:putative FmdB family regulatory protein|nr:FmdB family transcriptional regulator [Gammaproteobacteria bacterium]HAU10100.1 FmdB family transcriptional regulator [Gammaproteobacteria bacterium]HIN60005.1 zinc ribbon domain-containing protein [Gammaproteobacteria bacterium]
MPFYEYSCESCGHELEALQRLSAEPLVDCPACGAAALRKKVSAAAFRLKGTGWYETDFKDSGKPKTEGDDKTDGNKDSKADGKQEAATDDSSAKSSDSATDGGKSTASSPADSDKSSGKSQGTSAKKDSDSTSASTGTD